MGREAGRAPIPGPQRPRPLPRPCAALHRGNARSGPDRKGKARGLPLLRNRAEDPPRGWERGWGEETECSCVKAGWGCFPETSQSPSPSKGSPQDPSAPQRNALHNLSGEGRWVPGRRLRRARSPFPASPAPRTPRPGESRGVPAGGKAVAEGRPARTRRRQRGARPLRIGR